jgi:DNA-binding response OmpR family regulator
MLQVLVVDPDTEVAAVLADELQETFGALVSRAASGEVAAQVLSRLPCDLAVIEAMLPDISGFELAERAANGNVPALMISGHPQGQQACRIHGYPHLDKPFGLRDLVAAAKVSLSHGQQNIGRLHKAYQSLTATIGRTQTVREQGRQIRDEARQIRSKSQQNRLESSRIRAQLSSARDVMRAKNFVSQPDTLTAIEILAALDKIDRLKRLLQQDRTERLGEQIERTVKGMLAEEDAKLAALGQTGRSLSV